MSPNLSPGEIQADSKPQNAEEMATHLTNDLRVRLYPRGKVGDHALALWKIISEPLLRGECIEITVKALGLDMHRQELKRARDAMLATQLIQPAGESSQYELGEYDPYEQLFREEMHFLYGVEELCRIIGTFASRSSDPG